MSWFRAPTEGRAHPSTPGDAPPLRRSEARLSGTVPVGRVGQAGQRRVKCAWTARARELSSVPDDRRSGDEAPTAPRRRSVRATESTGRIGSWARRPRPGRESPVRRAVRSARTPSTPARLRRGLPAGSPEIRARKMRGEPAVPRRRSADARGARDRPPRRAAGRSPELRMRTTGCTRRGRAGAEGREGDRRTIIVVIEHQSVRLLTFEVLSAAAPPRADASALPPKSAATRCIPDGFRLSGRTRPASAPRFAPGCQPRVPGRNRCTITAGGKPASWRGGRRMARGVLRRRSTLMIHQLPATRDAGAVRVALPRFAAQGAARRSG